MKKVNLLILLTQLFVGINCFAEDDVPHELKTPSPDCKIVYYQGRVIGIDEETGKKRTTNPYWFNQGVDLKKYEPDEDPGLEQLTKNEIEKVTNAEEYNKNYYVVGHSQGGPRTLAYATMLKEMSDENPEKYDYSQLKGLFTVSGIDRGAKILEGGFGNIKKYFLGIGDQLENLICGVLGCFGSLGGAVCEFAKVYDCLDLFNFLGNKQSTLSLGLNFLLNIENIFPSVTISEAINLNSNTILKYLPRAWGNAAEESIQQLYDMMPRSKFMENYVIDTTKETKKKQTGSKLVAEWKTKKVGFLKIPYLVIRNDPVYTYYDVYYDNEVKFDDNLPVGYIVGEDPGILKMLKGYKDGSVDNSTYDVMREIIDYGIPHIAGVCEAVNIVEGIICTGYLNFVGTALHAADAVRCSSCWHYFSNFDKHSNELIGESVNDGLVAKSCQTISKDKHSNVVGIAEYPELCHTLISPVNYFSPREYKEIEDSPDHRTNDKISDWIAKLKQEEELEIKE